MRKTIELAGTWVLLALCFTLLLTGIFRALRVWPATWPAALGLGLLIAVALIILSERRPKRHPTFDLKRINVWHRLAAVLIIAALFAMFDSGLAGYTDDLFGWHLHDHSMKPIEMGIAMGLFFVFVLPWVLKHGNRSVWK